MQKFYSGSNNLIRLLFGLKMKLTLALIILVQALVLANTPTSGQSMKEVRISLEVKQQTLRDVLKIVEKKSAFSIGYNAEAVNANRKVTIAAQNKTVLEVLEFLVKDYQGTIRQINTREIILDVYKPVIHSVPGRTNVTFPLSITGLVTDKQTGEPLIGVALGIVGTTFGTQTDARGNFTLNMKITAADPVLSVSYIGYRTQRIVLNAELVKSPLRIMLEADRTGLDEVVVTGQGINISKRRLSTNVISIGEKELQDIPATRFDQLLQAKLPNAQIRLTGGQAGATSIMRSRGVNSGFINSTPIIYVDGVRLDNLNTNSTLSGGSASGAAISSIADIPLENIEKVEFVNGGAATTLYGSDAANGVIQIITKKSGPERTSITIETQTGVETPTTDFLKYKRTKDLLFENGLFQKHNLGINGSKGSVGYSFSAGYLNTQGVQIFNQNHNRKIDFRSGFNAALGSKLTYESSFSYTNNTFKRNRNGNQGGYTGLWFAESGASSITGPKFNPNLDAQSEEEFTAIKAYVDEAERLQDNNINVNRFITSQVFKYSPLKNLVFKATGGVDYRVQRQTIIQTNKYISHTTNAAVNNQGFIDNFDRKYLGLTFETNGQYELKLADFSFVSTIGWQLFRNEDQQIQYRGDNIRDGARIIRDAASRTSTEAYLEAVNYGMYVQENVGFKNKLFLDLGLRADGNPAFGDNIGLQYYPKIGLSYIPSTEKYFEPLRSVISSMKIRGNYGLAGNLPVPFSNQRTISFSGFNGAQAAYFGQPGNPNLKPEKTGTLEASIDLGFLNDRILITGGFYHSATRDALFSTPPAPSTGEINQFRNIGEILNRGLEFNTVFVPLQKKSYTLSINASLNTLYNKVVSSGGAAPFNINGFSARTVQTVVQEGYPVGFIRGNLGVFDDSGLLTSTTPQSYLGTTLPDLFGSMGLNFKYKALSIFANADYQKGAFAVSFDRQFRFNYGADTEGIPQAEIDKSQRTRWLDVTNRFVEKTDFIKVRTIGATYTFAPRYLKGAIKGVSIGFSAVNPLNFSSSSFDPEATISGSTQGQNGATTGGVSYATYSAPRQFLGNIRLNF
ncbi:TonB-dependent receptor domain-containing protein [Desertivirga brevis]|uniref:TonB-dependent receptor domain-containing protein n=1 Tax=Desertivirga brevis TaxID=2810310 RepID=UPI001A95F519|nr:TonB-dependent receptor [Pedobacter sp. SYSU D00873]